jgi:DNA-binding FadR family transcriptional regulator
MHRENGDELGPSRVSRAEALARRLEQEIIAGSLAPGERLGTKEELRQRFGVAFATLNEAVRLMEMRGVVAARPGPGGGLFVGNLSARARLGQLALGVDPTPPTLGDCVVVRNVLEPEVCREAARGARAADLAALSAIVDEMQRSLDDPQAYLRLNWKFHRHVGGMVGNSVLRGIYVIVIDVLAEGLDDFEFGGEGQEAIDVHRALTEAIAAGPAPALDKAVRRHQERSPLPSSG